MKIVDDVKEKKILLLQGPMGSYFNTLDTKFTNEGAKVFRIGFNAGDEFFARTDHYTGYKDKPKNWQKFVEEFYKKYDIQMLFVFGDCRFYQKIAIDIEKKLQIEVFVFEEGYIRPNFITLEKYGVNGYSPQPKERTFYDNLIFDDNLIEEIKSVVKFKSTFIKGISDTYFQK